VSQQLVRGVETLVSELFLASPMVSRLVPFTFFSLRVCESCKGISTSADLTFDGRDYDSLRFSPIHAWIVIVGPLRRTFSPPHPHPPPPQLMSSRFIPYSPCCWADLCKVGPQSGSSSSFVGPRGDTFSRALLLLPRYSLVASVDGKLVF